MGNPPGSVSVNSPATTSWCSVCASRSLSRITDCTSTQRKRARSAIERQRRWIKDTRLEGQTLIFGSALQRIFKCRAMRRPRTDDASHVGDPGSSHRHRLRAGTRGAHDCVARYGTGAACRRSSIAPARSASAPKGSPAPRRSATTSTTPTAAFPPAPMRLCAAAWLRREHRVNGCIHADVIGRTTGLEHAVNPDGIAGGRRLAHAARNRYWGVLSSN
jgi:hypothetical protein